MRLVPCLDCGPPTSHGSRCEQHQAERDRAHDRRRARPSPSRRGLGRDHRNAGDIALAAATVCHWCGQPPTPGNPLTRDHVIARIDGGTNTPSNYVAGCLSCNSRRGANQTKHGQPRK